MQEELYLSSSVVDDWEHLHCFLLLQNRMGVGGMGIGGSVYSMTADKSLTHKQWEQLPYQNKESKQAITSTTIPALTSTF